MRWIVRIVMALALMAVLLVALVFMLPSEKIGNIASAQLEKATGRTLTLSGSFTPSLYPTLGLKTGPVTISNADWAGDAPMIEASSASIGVGLAALWGGDIEIKTLALQDPVIRLARAKDGRVNWVFDTQKTAAEPSARGGQISLDEGIIRGGRILFDDAMTDQRYDVSAINADMSLPLNGKSARIEGTAEWDGTPVGANLRIGNLSAFGQGEMSELNGTLDLGSATVSLNGMVQIGQTPDVSLAYRAKIPNLRDLALLGEMPASVLKVDISGQVNSSGMGLTATATGTLQNNGVPVRIDASARGAQDWLDTNDLRVSVDAESEDVLSAQFVGGIDTKSGSLSGDIETRFRNISKAGVLLTGNPIRLPNGLGNSGRASGKLTLRGQDFSLRDASFALGTNALSGQISGTLGAVPYISASLAGSALDISAFTGGSNGAKKSSGSGWSKDPISLSGLSGVNADIGLKARSVDIGVTQLGRVNVAAKLRNGVLSANLNEVQAFSGNLTGTVSLSGRGGISMDSNVRANDMRLEQLLGSIIDFKRLTGKGDARLKLSGTGNSLHALMNTLSGDGSLEIANGAILGIDLAAMMRNLKKAFGGFEGATEFTSLTGTFSMSKGVLTNTDMLLTSPLFKAQGQGRVDIGGQAMNYRVTPTRLSKDAEFSVPVDIEGPWGNLKFRPDLAALVSLLGNGALEDKAKEEIDRVKELLENPEEAIKDSVEDRLKKEVLSRLGLSTDTPQEEVTSTSRAAVSTSPRPRTRPGDLNTAQVAPAAPVVEEPVAAKPKPLPQNREELEEAVKDKVEDEVKKLLLDGLFGN